VQQGEPGGSQGGAGGLIQLIAEAIRAGQGGGEVSSFVRSRFTVYVVGGLEFGTCCFSILAPFTRPILHT